MCDFDKDFCDWEVLGSDYKFTRKTADELANSQIPGPSGDIYSATDSSFVIASDAITGENGEGGSTSLKSPMFLLAEHPTECFDFWFQFGVSILFSKVS